MPERAKQYRLPQQRPDKNRPDATQRGYDRRWKKKRAAWLAAHPLCVACESKGRIVGATDVDHVIPHRGDMRLFWSGELQSLCSTCHSRKTRRGE